jgi:hypothetical protein
MLAGARFLVRENVEQQPERSHVQGNEDPLLTKYQRPIAPARRQLVLPADLIVAAHVVEMFAESRLIPG